MAEVKTFSSVIDQAVARIKRPARQTDVIAYANNTIREIAVLSHFFSDLIEDEFASTADPHLWTRPALLRVIRTAKYKEDNIWPEFIPPGRKQEDEDCYYYASGPDTFVFAGVTAGNNIDVAYYTYPRTFKYYADVAGSPTRPAKYDDETEEWTYLSGGAYISTLGTDALDQAARDKVTNWIIFKWENAVIEGIFAKVFKIIEEETRARSAFALYKVQHDNILKGEQHETLDY